MPNWYSQEKKSKPATVRYNGSISANIIVPEQENKEAEREFAYKSLSTYLPEGGFVGESVINFNIEGVDPYDKLV